MINSRIDKITQKAMDTPLEFTRRVMDHSEKLRHPSVKAAKIGFLAGRLLSFLLLSAGLFLLIAGKQLWALGTAAAGSLTLVSHFIAAGSGKRKQ